MKALHSLEVLVSANAPTESHMPEDLNRNKTAVETLNHARSIISIQIVNSLGLCIYFPESTVCFVLLCFSYPFHISLHIWQECCECRGTCPAKLCGNKRR